MLLLWLLLLLLPSNLRVGVECDFRKLTANVADGAVVVVVAGVNRDFDVDDEPTDDASDIISCCSRCCCCRAISTATVAVVAVVVVAVVAVASSEVDNDSNDCDDEFKLT